MSIVEPPRPAIYVSFEQEYVTRAVLLTVAEAGTDPLLPLLRDAMKTLDPDVAFYDARTLEAHMGNVQWQFRLGAELALALGLLAVTLAAGGLYGIMVFRVRRSDREIGIRIALGAARRGVIGLVVRQAARLLLVGGVIGIGLAIAVANLLRSQLFGVAPADPVTIAVVLAVLGGVGAMAAVLPARRAVAIDPVVTLKSE
jgi:ABC-type lipoprotein release transport system permease subunit